LLLLIQIKNQSHGIFHKCRLDDFFVSSQIKTRQTFDKRLQRLVSLGWISYNEKTGWYKILSFKRITRLLDCSSKEYCVVSPDINTENFQAFLFSSILVNLIRKSKYFYAKTKEGKRIARDTGDYLAFEFFDSSLGKRRRYFTISMLRMAMEVGISRQRANKLKLQADKNRFIDCFERKEYLGTIKSDMCRYKHLMNFKWYVEFKKGRDKVIHAYRILPDEVLSNLKIKRKMHY
jgi:hypothetical protein